MKVESQFVSSSAVVTTSDFSLQPLAIRVAGLNSNKFPTNLPNATVSSSHNLFVALQINTPPVESTSMLTQTSLNWNVSGVVNVIVPNSIKESSLKTAILLISGASQTAGMEKVPNTPVFLKPSVSDISDCTYLPYLFFCVF